MSHELRTPLSAIIGFAEVITQGLMAPNASQDKALEYAGDIKDAGHHLLALVNDILDIAKVEAGKHELSEDLLDFPELAQSCVALVRGRATKAKIALETDIPESCVTLYADGRKLKQVLVNLLSNSVKFTPRKGKVTLSIRPVGETAAEIGGDRHGCRHERRRNAPGAGALHPAARRSADRTAGHGPGPAPRQGLGRAARRHLVDRERARQRHDGADHLASSARRDQFDKEDVARESAGTEPKVA